VDAFALAADSVGDAPELRAALDRVVERMRAGEAPSDAMREEPVFSAEVVRTVRAGEDRGDLEAKCLHVAAQLEAGIYEAGAGSSPAEAAPDLLVALVREATARRASHLHLLPTPGGGSARVRVGGRLEAGETIPDDAYAALLRALRAEAPRGTVRRELEVDGRAVALGVSVAGFAEGTGAVLRIEPVADPAEVEILPGDRERLRAIGPGPVLSVGPADTAFLAAVGAMLAGGEKVCVVADSPLPIPGALRLPTAEAGAALAQDPDVVVLPDLTEPEAAALAARFAHRGRRVVGAVDAPDEAAARKAVPGTEVREVIVPRLLPRPCPDCRRSEEGAGAEASACETCGGTGVGSMALSLEGQEPGETRRK
jgi:type II secretory ATPase GspE/PulE/Tfp pilus assembly ATPase PilB-like protein